MFFRSSRPSSSLSVSALSLIVLATACAGAPEIDDSESADSSDDPVDVDGDGIPDNQQGTGGTGAATGGTASGGGLATGGGGPITTSPCLDDLLIDDFEDPATGALYRPYNDATPGGTLNASFEEDGSPEGSRSLHMVGSGYTTWGAGIARTFDALLECRGRSTGVRFRAKGNGALVFAAPVKAVVPTEEGGNCAAAEECHNSHETSVTLTTSWETYEISWTELSQPDWGPVISFDPEEIHEILFAARPESMPFDFWIDDIELIDNGTPIDGGTGGSGGGDGSGGSSGGACVLDGILGEAGFNSWFMTRRDPFYTYANLCTALQGFPGFANSGNADNDKREVAAFFANVARETGELDYIEQIVKDPPTYFGRGPIQLTHSYNYQAAGDFLGINLVANPDLVATDGVITWQTALWFWMHSDGAGKGTCHGAIASSGFGQTINIINGGLECHGENEAARQRITYYEGFCESLGVSPGGNLTCW
jgi:hypothetical protein